MEFKESENSQKKVLLSVLGVAILVVAVVGISFAAFTVTKGSSTNSIATGSLMVSYNEDAQEIDISDALPMSDEDALSSKNLQAADESFEFTVSTAADEAITIPYDISLTPVTVEATEVALKDDEVKAYLAIKNGAAVSEVTKDSGVVKKVSELTPYTGHGRTGSYLLHHGADVYTAADGSNTTTYVLKMWVAEDTVLDVTAEAGKTYKAKVNVDSHVNPIGE